MAALTRSARPPGPSESPHPNWRWGRQVTRAAAESREAAAGHEGGSTGGSLVRRSLGLGLKRKATTGDAAAPLAPPGMRARGGASAAQTGDEERAAGRPSESAADRGV